MLGNEGIDKGVDAVGEGIGGRLGEVAGLHEVVGEIGHVTLECDRGVVLLVGCVVVAPLDGVACEVADEVAVGARARVGVGGHAAVVDFLYHRGKDNREGTMVGYKFSRLSGTGFSWTPR